ncbi:MAG: glycerophosphodiester phosphodiesterase family protein [Candidatus Marinimicrobia bacterium]|nr:glycerophosphodiester phosphodiesterase family protein [Candidatus Neomarinimicrobiota bacterium]
MKRLYTLLLFNVILIVFICAETKIIAHRGFSSAAPENTQTAFREAITVGADYFELDVHQSRDGKLVVIHDGSVNRVSSNGMTGKIADMSFREIRKVRAGYSKKYGETFKNARIPTLKQALRLAKNKIRVCVEIKAPDIEAAVLKAVYDLKMEKQVIIFAFDYGVLKNMREMDKDIPLLYLRSVVDSTVIADATAIKAAAIGAGRPTAITAELLKEVHANDMELWQWTVNDPNDMQRLLDIGIDGIITDHPDKALTLRAARAK